jgi:hypothetical protein
MKADQGASTHCAQRASAIKGRRPSAIPYRPVAEFAAAIDA